MKKERPPIEEIDIAWIDEMQKEFQISDYELSLQCGQDRSYMGKVRGSGTSISKGIKSAIWHYFKKLELLKMNSWL